MESRRSLLKKVSGLAFGVTPLLNPLFKETETTAKRNLRIVHFTDSHLEPGNNSAKGVENALRGIQSLKDQPDLMLIGGDVIFDALKRDKQQVKDQWELWNNILSNECKVPVIGCLGNHDVWGWGAKEAFIKNPDKLYGKQWATDELKMPHRYFSVDKNGWLFIVLDSVHFSTSRDYISKIDEEQFEWLQSQLASASPHAHICIVSHIPIISFASSIFSNSFLSNDFDYVYQWGLMHTDVVRIKDTFYQHNNIRLCISGHLHMQEQVEYLGIKYLCNGAVSGNWWQGKRFEFSPSFTVIDLFSDGTSQHQWINY